MEYETTDGGPKRLRLLEPQGCPEIIECDGHEYVSVVRCAECGQSGNAHLIDLPDVLYCTRTCRFTRRNDFCSSGREAGND